MGNRVWIGIDVGSTTSAVAALDADGTLIAQDYAFHQGKVADSVRSILSGLLPAQLQARICGVASTSTSPRIDLPLGGCLKVDNRVAEIEALRRFHPETRTLLVVGAEKFARITFAADGEYRRMRRNASCAAGTGSFLDQQAMRLGLLGGSAELATRALSNAGDFPAIASRCSVFAKTDLIHAQAEGWSVEGICEGLCQGLARNIADTLFPGEIPEPPVFLAGGVSRNAAVIKHLSGLAHSDIQIDEVSQVYGAIGAALRVLATHPHMHQTFAVDGIAVARDAGRDYASMPLTSPTGDYPEFSSLKHFPYFARKTGPANPVEVDLYISPDALLRPAGSIASDQRIVPVLLGIDVGSTSTKAALLCPDGRVIAGFYTWTAGQPLEATQAIFEAIDQMEREHGLAFGVDLAATTGSGRKMVGTVIGADAMIDEISAHARAAVALDPTIDTIIEIGGQDSKFTVLKDGMVTFSQMNTVCAAGTGSFLAEQADRLGVKLEDAWERALGARAPLTSDRCTVFMERDLNYFQGQGYKAEELLAASLFSVCDNYLGKVARKSMIGEKVAFQGATARNRALVAAFERRLGKPVQVSQFCHLTGAIGAALEGKASGISRSSFRGFGIHALDLASRSERCELCTNHCRLRIVDVGGEDVACGFLCGRDYATKHFVRTGSRNLLRERDKLIQTEYRAVSESAVPRLGYPTIGIPSSLYLKQDAPFWKAFFEQLGFPCILAKDDAQTLRAGKSLAGAEFCGPVALFYGQTQALLESANIVFLPVYLEDKPARRAGTQVRRCYCNYSQYASIVARCSQTNDRVRIMNPLLSGRSGNAAKAMDELRKALATCLSGWGISVPSRRALAQAHAACLEARGKAHAGIKCLFSERASDEHLSVVLLGRPYAVLSEAMGKAIVDHFFQHDIGLVYADMLPDYPDTGVGPLDPLLAAFHWRYAAEILESADFCAGHSGYYPVIVTSFKCSPDSFALEWFKKILDRAGKPYLILQIDDHDSSVGYETRIEAGLRSFRNHFAKSATPPIRHLSVLPSTSWEPASLTIAPTICNSDTRGKTILIPNWDPIVCQFLAANLRASGIDARVLAESPGSIRRAMSGNSGQCIPVNIIAQDCIEQIERDGLDPAKTVLWVTAGQWSCNLPLYPQFLKMLMERRGSGMEDVSVYEGDITFLSFGPKALIGAFHAFTSGGTLRRLACRMRPYETEVGVTDQLVQAAIEVLVPAFEEGGSMQKAYERAFNPFLKLPIQPRTRPKVAIFGDFYSRDNDVLNQDLIRTIEASGGEVITTTYIEYLKSTLDPLFDQMLMDKNYGEWARDKAALTVIAAVEKTLTLKAGAIFGQPLSWKNPGYVDKLRLFGITPEHSGECFDNALKIFSILKQHPDIALFVQANPAFCCPSIVTESMAREIERITGVPVVTITYDGTGESKNDAIEPYLAFGRKKSRRGKVA